MKNGLSVEGIVNLSFELDSRNPSKQKNIAHHFGFDTATVIWSEDEAVRQDLARLCAHAVMDEGLGAKTLAGIDLSAEAPFNLKTALFEDMDMKDLRLPAGTDLSDAVFEGCNVYGVNFKDCKTGA